MGTQNSKGLSREVEGKKLKHKEINFEFQSCHEHWVANESFISELVHENSNLATNMIRYFPNARKDYDQFIQMAMFLRKIELKPERSAFAKQNAGKTTLIDRYFMLVKGIDTWENLSQIKLNVQEMQDLFIQIMKIFIPNPKKGFIDKLLKYLRVQSAEDITIKQFGTVIRQNFPQLSKHLRDYFTSKFRDMQKQAFLLRNFNSGILHQDAAILSLQIGELTGKQIKQLYNSETCGLSFHSYEKRIIGYDGPWLLLIESNDKETYKFGSFQSGPIRDVINYQGDLRGFLFSIEPSIRLMTTDKGDNGNHYFFINTIDEKVSKRRRGIGFGGDANKKNCKLWIDQDLDKSTVFNGNDITYGYGTLANPMSTNLSIRKMEIWGLGTKFDLQKQAEYWQQREQEAMKRRKVNKKQLFDGNAGMLFQKTFAHRDQVVGEIERTKKGQN